MAWSVSYTSKAERDLRKLDASVRSLILDYMDDRIALAVNPRRFGKPLLHEKRGLWRYRVGDYRIVCEIQDERILVLVVAIGHRRDIYN